MKRTSLGSLSEASQVFDPGTVRTALRNLAFVPELLRRIFEDLAGRAAAKDAPPRPKGFPADLDVIATDGSVIETLPRMVWALWLRKEQRRRPAPPRPRYTQGDSGGRGDHDRADERDGAAQEASGEAPALRLRPRLRGLRLTLRSSRRVSARSTARHLPVLVPLRVPHLAPLRREGARASCGAQPGDAGCGVRRCLPPRGAYALGGPPAAGHKRHRVCSTAPPP